MNRMNPQTLLAVVALIALALAWVMLNTSPNPIALELKP